MYFFIENDDLLEKYDTIQDKISADIRADGPTYNKKTENENEIIWQ